MISLIVCSRSRDINEDLKKNIAATIGCDYELCVIDNSANKYTIFSAYNKGVEMAKGDILCFMHEDVIYYTKNWGINVEKRFKQDRQLGLISNLGTHILPKTICSVGDSMILSSNYYTKGKGVYYHENKYFDETGAAEVVVIDGMWYCMRAQLFTEGKVRYDESYEGFHYYDMDICMQVWKAGYTCKIVDDVLLEHFSGGVINKAFIHNSHRFYEKWKDMLPMIKGVSLTENEIKLSTYLCESSGYGREVVYYYDKYRWSISYKFKQILKQIFRRR